MIKAILWDNDGVLVDTEKIFFKATQDTLKAAGMELTREQFIDFSLIKGYGLWDYVKAGGLDIASCEDLRRKRNAHYADLLSKTPTLMDGVRQTLASLHGNYTMGVVTSSLRDHFDIIHKSTNLLQYFDFVITSDDCQNTKPHPEPYLKGLEKAGVSADQCLAVEDSARGLRAANQAGLFALMIPHAMTDPNTYQGDYALLDSVRDVQKAIDLRAKGQS